jgi:putative transposase
VKKPYHIVSREAQTASASMEEFAKANGQILLPLVELITQARLAINEVIDSIGRQTIETILSLSAEQIAGPRTPGKSSGDIRWHGSQKGRVSLADRQLAVKRPRLRHKEAGEVRVPAYESLQENSATAQRMMGALLRGVSTREYAEVLPAMAETAGVSRSSVSRQICSCCTSTGSASDRITLLAPLVWIGTGANMCLVFKWVRPRTRQP